MEGHEIAAHLSGARNDGFINQATTRIKLIRTSGKTGGFCLTAWYNLIKGNEQCQEPGFEMEKCPLCDKKIPQDAKFCPLCGWDLTDHELTPPQIVRIQEEIIDARFTYMRWNIAMGEFTAVALVFLIFSILATAEVIVVQAPWVMSGIAAAFLSGAAAFGFLGLRHHNKQNRLKTMLRDRQSSR